MKYTITEDIAGKTVTEFLRQTSGVSARDCQKLLRSKKVTINGKAAHSKRILQNGDTVIIRRPAEQSTLKTTANELLPTILYEDASTLVVYKPPFCQIHPTERTKTGTLSHRIAAYYAKTNQQIPVRLVHRLDRDTSGCVLVAKTKDTQRYYTEQFQNGGVTKTYAALVKGQLPQINGTVDAPIGKDPTRPNRRRITPSGKPAKTQYQVITLPCTTTTSTVDTTAFGASNVQALEPPILTEAVLTALRTYNGTLVYCQIPTGRTHQIRLHMKYLGCPVLGDTMYGQAAPPFTRQCLHALCLTFVPYGQKTPLTITAPLPKNFGINC